MAREAGPPQRHPANAKEAEQGSSSGWLHRAPQSSLRDRTPAAGRTSRRRWARTCASTPRPPAGGGGREPNPRHPLRRIPTEVAGAHPTRLSSPGSPAARTPGLAARAPHGRQDKAHSPPGRGGRRGLGAGGARAEDGRRREPAGGRRRRRRGAGGPARRAGSRWPSAKPSPEWRRAARPGLRGPDSDCRRGKGHALICMSFAWRSGSGPAPSCHALRAGQGVACGGSQRCAAGLGGSRGGVRLQVCVSPSPDRAVETLTVTPFLLDNTYQKQ